MYNPLALIFCLLYLSNCVQSNDCGQDETLYCRGERALRNVIRNLNKSDKPLVIMPGMEIVPMHNESAVGKENPEETLLDSLANYLRTHEVNVKLVDLLEEGKLAEQASEARKKDKGQGLLLAMALMFGKMMAVLGLGGIGALAMKALGVAMVALMMAGMLGLKQLLSMETSRVIAFHMSPVKDIIISDDVEQPGRWSPSSRNNLWHTEPT